MDPSNTRKTEETDTFGEEDYETLYWVVIDFLHSEAAVPEARRLALKELAARLSSHALAKNGKAESGVVAAIRRPPYIDYRDSVRNKLLKLRNPAEFGTWAVYAEGVEEDPQAILLAIVEGTYLTAVEKALEEPGFITEGMGGQIDPLG